MSQTNFQKVKEFMTAFGQSTFDTPQVEQLQNKKIVDLRIALITEEFSEIENAVKNNDFVEYVDGIADLLVVTYGTGLAFGINLDDWIDLFCASEGINRENNTNYDMVKEIMKINDEYNLHNREDLYAHTMVKFYINKIKINIKNLTKTIDEVDLIKISFPLTSIIFNTYKLALLFDIDINKAFDIVHESNMSKLCISETEASQTVEWYKENEKRYPNPSYKKATNDKYWIVYEQSNGKILKSINYKPANLKDI